MEDASLRFHFNPPKTKEAYLYRTIFEKYYPGCAKLYPYYWMPKWIKASDPSPRILKFYKS